MTDPIQKTLHVPLRPQKAFNLFTKNLKDWWPIESHSLSAGEGEIPQQINLDRHEGGYITETKHDGGTSRWGTITKWDEGRAIGISWYVGRTEDEATDLDVVFTPTDMGTRIELTHSGFERLGEVATAMHENYFKGWDFVLTECFGQYCFRQKVALSTT